MNINFVESNPMPVKAAMALMGLLEPVWRLPMVPPSPANLAKIETVLEQSASWCTNRSSRKPDGSGRTA